MAKQASRVVVLQNRDTVSFASTIGTFFCNIAGPVSLQRDHDGNFIVTRTLAIVIVPKSTAVPVVKESYEQTPITITQDKLFAVLEDGRVNAIGISLAAEQFAVRKGDFFHGIWENGRKRIQVYDQMGMLDEYRIGMPISDLTELCNHLEAALNT